MWSSTLYYSQRLHRVVRGTHFGLAAPLVDLVAPICFENALSFDCLIWKENDNRTDITVELAITQSREVEVLARSIPDLQALLRQAEPRRLDQMRRRGH
jgi:hypothetical protein